jgi:hypothetical protein
MFFQDGGSLSGSAGTAEANDDQPVTSVSGIVVHSLDQCFRLKKVFHQNNKLQTKNESLAIDLDHGTGVQKQEFIKYIVWHCRYGVSCYCGSIILLRILAFMSVLLFFCFETRCSCPVDFDLSGFLLILSELSQNEQCRADIINQRTVEMLVHLCTRFKHCDPNAGHGSDSCGMGSTVFDSTSKSLSTEAMCHIATVIGNLALEKESIPQMVSEGVVRVLINICEAFADSEDKTERGLVENSSLAVITLVHTLHEAKPVPEACQQVRVGSSVSSINQLMLVMYGADHCRRRLDSSSRESTP